MIYVLVANVMLSINHSLPAALTEAQALAHYPSTPRCRQSEGQEWLDCSLGQVLIHTDTVLNRY